MWDRSLFTALCLIQRDVCVSPVSAQLWTSPINSQVCITFDVLGLALKAVQGEDDAAYQHVRVHQRAVDLCQKGLKLQVRISYLLFISLRLGNK